MSVQRRQLATAISIATLAITALGCASESTPSPPWLWSQETVEAGSECANGGVRFVGGIDQNEDGVLSSDEITERTTMCQPMNGSDGVSGSDGNDGAPGPRGEDGSDGEDGAQGADGNNGSDGNDGTNGSDGEDGVRGVNTLMRTQDEPPGAFCEFGGLRIESGLDDGGSAGLEAQANNAVLDDDEVRERDFLCRSVRPALVVNGLDGRLSNASCLAPASSNSEGIRVEPAFPGVSFASPVAMFQPPGDPGRWYVVEQRGTVQTFVNDPEVTSTEVAIDVSSKVHLGYEPGLLGLAFHPDWPTVDEVFIFYVTLQGVQPGFGTRSVVSRFSLMSGSDHIFDPMSEVEILSMQKLDSEHNGGGMAFDADGYLIIGVGDGGGWPPRLSQDPSSLAGKFLRIDVNTPDPARGTAYSIPADNPFVNEPGYEPEIYASGLRNPWRWSIDPLTQSIYAGDVGLLTFEEVNRIEAGKDYGWPTAEGDRCRVEDWTDDTSCDPEAFELPITMYKNAMGCSITGGFVYRGDDIPHLYGKFVYGDFCLGRIWGYDVDGSPENYEYLTDAPINISAFGLGLDGEIYPLDWWTGGINKIVGSDPVRMPERLSNTGCVQEDEPSKLAPQAISYRVNAPFYSEDTVYKERAFFLPDGETVFVANSGDWVFPEGSVIAKQFYLGDELFETRLLTRSADGWAGWSYRWDEELNDGVRIDISTSTTLSDGTSWIYPDRGQCLHCHTAPTNRTLGPETRQMNGAHYYPESERWSNQLDTLRAIGALRNAPSGDVSTIEAMPSPTDVDAPIEDRAKAYLHTNCAQCHQPGGGGYGLADFRYSTPLSGMNICNVSAWSSSFGNLDAALLVPGAKENSLIYERLSRADAHAMHPYRATVDVTGRDVVGAWIDSLSECPPGPN
ncbi:MAG: PQQ-dependent sugar dehydrogenase [Myxococcota bacterium]